MTASQFWRSSHRFSGFDSMSAPFRDQMKWPFIEPYSIILGNSAGHVKHSDRAGRPGPDVHWHPSMTRSRKVLKKWMGSGIKETPF
jgi:hypothetical protein